MLGYFSMHVYVKAEKRGVTCILALSGIFKNNKTSKSVSGGLESHLAFWITEIKTNKVDAHLLFEH